MDFQDPINQQENARCTACSEWRRSPRVKVGDIIHGYARGAFGRDSYECKRVEGVGPDWVVVREVTLFRQGHVLMATGSHIREELVEYAMIVGCDCLHNEG